MLGEPRPGRHEDELLGPHGSAPRVAQVGTEHDEAHHGRHELHGSLGGDARVNDDENLAVAWRRVDALEDVPPLHVRAVRWALEAEHDAAGRFVADGTERSGPVA